MKWSDDKLDILQNLEFSIMEVWRANRDMTDYSAGRAYEAAYQLYRAEMRGHTPKPVQLTGHDLAAFESLKQMCDFRLGRGRTPVSAPENIPPVPIATMVECLRELGKSVERHTKIGGRQGYLTFVEKFVR